ncbi:hypothetical protein SAMN05421810_11352 [Amycolatopsis arida]|uniref:Uncharacterized protein n=1 Tax=Amycolatopsis arida TaxID=587909 RepID=A0A1I6AL69_9PSEU|nr:hypothetical protein [Amycolatopsis arida]TDX87369.1 hypothetical protein CLV69_11352 [Amycolatopsis arida]SFQ69446.1 hypothetical protein SAMN05421810_11352 [Amycolatopsis arida]
MTRDTVAADRTAVASRTGPRRGESIRGAVLDAANGPLRAVLTHAAAMSRGADLA